MSTMENNGSREQASVKSAARVLDVLDILSGHPGGLSFTELMKMLAIPKSSMHGLLTLMRERGYLDHDASGRSYTLGIRAWENGQAYLRHRDLAREAHASMCSIVDTLNETVQLAILDDLEVVYLARVDCSHPVRLASQVGARLPAYATGLGKALLANLPDQDLIGRLRNRALTAFTESTITKPVALLQAMRSIQERGYATDNEEYTPGLRCVAVPIRDRYGHDTAALSVAIPLMRASNDQWSLALLLLAKASLNIARRMGCTSDDPRLRRLVESPVEVDFPDMAGPRAQVADAGKQAIEESLGSATRD
jgi:DNA-binding IclR family transcriptional regulator